MGFREALLDAWALIMPVECAGCGKPDRALCTACTAELVPHPVVRSTPGGLQVVTALRYEGIVRHVLLSFKEQQRTDVSAALAAALSVALDRAAPAGAGGGPGADGDVAPELVPIPTSRAAYRRRGYDPVALLLRKTRRPASRVLGSLRSTAAQKTLAADQRAANRRGSLVATGDLAGRRFVLVDDILTTGATLDEASRALTQAGGTVVGSATLAFTPRLFAVRDNGREQDYGGAKGAR